MRAIGLAVVLTALAAGCGSGGGDPQPMACRAGPALPLTTAPLRIPGAPGSEDFTFDRDGYLLALDSGRSLVKLARGAPPMLVVPNVVANGRGLRVLPGGDVVIADMDRSLLVRVDATGAARRLTTSIANPNGLALGPGGKLYATDFGITGDVYRVDPDTGDTVVLGRPAPGSNGIAFSPNYQTLYVGDHDNGIIFQLQLKPDGTATAPTHWAQGLVRPDGLAVDSCGNLYVASWDRKLYRVDADGMVAVVTELPSIVSAVAFGSGKQGWDANSLYLMALQDGGVYEIPIGQQAAAPPL